MKTYKGKLTIHSETGLGPFPVLYAQKPNLDYWSQVVTFEKNEKYTVKITSKKGDVVYEGPWTYSRQNTWGNNYFASPKEITPRDWLKYCYEEHYIEMKKETKAPSKNAIITSLLDTDLYKITMQQFAVNQKKGPQVATYSVTCRTGEDLSVIKAKLEEQISYLKQLEFSDEELDFLSQKEFIKPDFIEFLRFFSLRGVDFKLEQKENQLLVRCHGNWEQSIIVEVPLLAIIQELYHDVENNAVIEDGRKKLKEKIELFKKSGTNLKFIDFGTRRRFSKSWHREVVETLKAELPNNLVGSSNILLAKDLGLKPVGTMAHEFFQAMQVLGTSFETSQKEALYAWRKEYGDQLSVALTDILGTGVFLNDCDKDLTEKYQGYRHDSGDPVQWGYRMLAHFHEMGIDSKTKTLVFSDGLDFETAIKIQNEFDGRVNLLFGIGTYLTNDFNSHRPLSLVMKLVLMNGKPTIKVSDTPSKAICESAEFKEYVLKYIKKVQKYPRINFAVDIVLTRVNNGKKEVLLMKRGDSSEVGFDQWCLPGGFVEYFETGKESAVREAMEELGVNIKDVTFVKAMDNPNRDPRGRTVSLVYTATTEEVPAVTMEAKELSWVSEIPKHLFFDHSEVLKGIL